MNATVILKDKRFEGVFDFGDKVVIEKIPYEEDTILNFKHVQDGVFTSADFKNDSWNRHMIGKPKFKKVPDNIAEKGSWKGFRVKSKNGEYYDDGCFKSILGYRALSEIFSKS